MFSRAAVNFSGGSPGALRATRNTFGAGCWASGNSNWARSVLICDVGKSPVTPTMVSVCCVLALSPGAQNVKRLPIASAASALGKSWSASGFEIRVTISAPARSSTVKSRPRKSGMPIVLRYASPTRVARTETNLGATFASVCSETFVMRPPKSNGRPSATVADATPLAFSRLSRALRMRKASSLSSAAASSFNGAAYNKSDLLAPAEPDPSRNMSAALERWVEQGTAPSAIVATKYNTPDNPSSGVKFTRPLCPYPQVARYKGAGSENDAANFACMAP